MADHILARLAGASLLVLALPAAAQDHTHHPAPPPRGPAPTPMPVTPPVDPHAGHIMSDQTAPAAGNPGIGLQGQEKDDDPHEGHEMASALGPWPMTRDASGTSWQPDQSSHGGLHARRDDWTLMGHARFNLVHDRQDGPRGDEKTFVSGMVMASALRRFDDGSSLTLRGMLSPEPLMGREGFPLLLAAGETADGVNPLVDRQHPHELVMELSASHARRLSETDSLFVYVGLPGEPAFGPPAFMHRMSAMDSPDAPITHHWLDSTHIVFGVATLGWVHRDFKLEASSFRGREPDQDRYDIEAPDLDSWAVRASWNPGPGWSLQASYADVTAPEQLEPDDDETKLSASVLHTRRLGRDGWWSSTLAWGRKTNAHDESKDGWLLETAMSPDDRWTVFARAERIETDELVPGAGGGHGPLYAVSKASIGMVRDWPVAGNVRFGLGALYSVNTVPRALEPLYGPDPAGAMVFARLRID